MRADRGGRCLSTPARRWHRRAEPKPWPKPLSLSGEISALNGGRTLLLMGETSALNRRDTSALNGGSLCSYGGRPLFLNGTGEWSLCPLQPRCFHLKWKEQPHRVVLIHCVCVSPQI